MGSCPDLIGWPMDDIQCAVLLARLERFDWEIERRLEIGAVYNDALDNAGIERVQQRLDRTNVFAHCTMMGADWDSLAAALKEQGIPTAVHYPIPLNEQTAYQAFCCSGCTPVAQRNARRVMSLPMGPDLDHVRQGSVLSALEGYLSS